MATGNGFFPIIGIGGPGRGEPISPSPGLPDEAVGLTARTQTQREEGWRNLSPAQERIDTARGLFKLQ